MHAIGGHSKGFLDIVSLPHHKAAHLLYNTTSPTVTTCNRHVSVKHTPNASQPLTAPNNGDPDPENHEKLFVYGTESDAEDEAAKDSDDDRAVVDHDIPPPPVDLLYDTSEGAL